MLSVENDLELIQMVADARYDGDASAMQTDLDELEYGLEHELVGSFRRVGNNCLVLYTNAQALAACETSPGSIRGVMVLDADTRLEATATAVGSTFVHTFVDTDSTVYHSDIAFSTIRRSDISRSVISNCMSPRGVIRDSTIDFSRIDYSDIHETTVVGSAVFNSVIKKRPLSNKHIRQDKVVDDPSAAEVLVNSGIKPRSPAST
jgi:hypothetical protein